MTALTSVSQYNEAFTVFGARSFFFKAASWFRQDRLPEGGDEATELMIRAMLPKSWFDKRAHHWVNRSFWSKLAVLSTVVFAFTVIGLLFSSAWILGLSALFVSLTLHFGLKTHHNQRIAQARTMATEAISLVQGLEETQHQLDESVRALVDVCGETKKTIDSLRTASEALHKATEHIEETSAKIDTQVNIVVDSTNTLVAAQKASAQVLEDTTAQALEFSTAIDESMSALSGVVDSANAFGDAVAQTKAQTTALANSVATFGLFVQKGTMRQCTNTKALDDKLHAQLLRMQARAKEQKALNVLFLSLCEAFDDSDLEPAPLGCANALGEVKALPVVSGQSFRLH